MRWRGKTPAECVRSDALISLYARQTNTVDYNQHSLAGGWELKVEGKTTKLPEPFKLVLIDDTSQSGKQSL